MGIDGTYPYGYSIIMALTATMAAALLKVEEATLGGFVNKGWKAIGCGGSINLAHMEQGLQDWQKENSGTLFKIPIEGLLAVYAYENEWYLIRFNKREV